MKDIYKILEEQNIDIENKEEFEKAFFKNYKSVAEFEKKSNEIKELKDNLKIRDNDIDNLKKQLDENGEDKEKLSKLSKELDVMRDKNANAEKQYQDNLKKQEYKFAVKEASSKLKFSSNAAKEHFEQKAIERNFAFENGELFGFDDFVKSYKEKDEGAFLNEKPEPAVFSGKSHRVGEPEKTVVHNSSEARII